MQLRDDFRRLISNKMLRDFFSTAILRKILCSPDKYYKLSSVQPIQTHLNDSLDEPSGIEQIYSMIFSGEISIL